ncbi:MAG: ribose 5-phosphate isomerase B [Chloroflexi bacterium]|nr:ribose 5-phosphate isomerase B [Chloroflexota bacterium]
MRVAIGNDHRGYALKVALAPHVQRLGHGLVDVGSSNGDTVDYPDYAKAVGQLIAEGSVDRGILVCGTGIGVSIAANKVRGVRAARCGSVEDAHLARSHNDANVLCLSGAFEPKAAQAIVDEFLATPFETGGRHARRVSKIVLMEQAEEGRPTQVR